MTRLSNGHLSSRRIIRDIKTKIMRRACFGQQYPDFSKSFILTTDASGIAVRGILLQGKINKDQSIA